MSATTAGTGRTEVWKRGIGLGVAGGIVAAIAMAMFAMIAAATYQGTGFFTPLYHIGSSLGGAAPMEAMEASMEQAQSGDLLTWFTGPALTGALVHMVAGMMWGAVFGLVVAVVRIPRGAVAPAGVAFGIVVMVVMAFVVLPVMASLFGSGDPIRNMPSMVGWGTFTAEHALFGLVVGMTTLSLGTRTIDLPSEPHAVSGHSAERTHQHAR